MGSMHTGLEEHRGLKEMAAFYAERAKGGAGLIVTGGVAASADCSEAAEHSFARSHQARGSP